MADRDCARLRELADELALGVLDGAERVEARTHLANCPECREYVLELTTVSDNLLALVPGAEPPVGFEDRVLSRLGITAGTMSAPMTEPIPAQQPPAAPAPAPPVNDLDRARERRAQRERTSRRWIPVAAAVVFALVFGVGGWAIGSNTGGTSGTAVASPGLLHGTLVSADHKTVGKVWAWPGKPSWVYMDVDTDQHATGMTVTCQVQQANGNIVTIGSFTLSNGYGHWGAPAPVGPGEKARLVDSEGSVIATANLTT